MKVRWIDPGDGGALSPQEARAAFRLAMFASSLLKSIPKKAKMGLHSPPERSLNSESLLENEDPLLHRYTGKMNISIGGPTS